ncbi:MAG TPA: ClpX C4-type zinc finger protein [Gammaproteobacteria bacterium]|nr:ClpX C4-type zinc finger protein [Gammaproteobacteria bacterium]
MLPRRKLTCSFCGKSAAQVAKLVAGRRGYICDVCAAEAHRIMSEWDSAAPLPPAPPSIGARIRRLLSRLSNDGSSTRALHRPA